MANKNQRASYKNNKDLLQAEVNAAAFFKAQFEKMHYMLESEKIYEEWTSLVIEKYPDQAKALGFIPRDEVVTNGLSIVEGTEVPTTSLTTSGTEPLTIDLNADIKE